MEKSMEEHIESLPLPRKRNVFLCCDIDDESITPITKEIIDINENDEYLTKFYELHGLTYTPKPIKLYIDSWGGSLYSALGFISVVKSSVVPVHTIVMGAAFSAGMLISIAGKRRFCNKNSTIMYHQLSGSSDEQTYKQAKDDVVEMERLQDIIVKHVLQHTKITKAKLNKIDETQKDEYFSATEALKNGLVDEIL